VIIAFHYIHICELMSAVKNRYCNSSIIAAWLLYHPMWGCMVNYTNKVMSSKYVVYVPHLRKKVDLW